MDTSKKRKLLSGASLGGRGLGKLKRVSLNAFESIDDNDEKNLDDTQTGVAGTNRSAGNEAEESNALDENQKSVIIKTAQWIANNNTMAEVLIEKSKDNPMLVFLTDKTASTAAGRYYRLELQRIQAEKEVQAVCSGNAGSSVTAIDTEIVTTNPAISITKTTNMNGSTSVATAGTTNGTTTGATTGATTARRNRWGPTVTPSTNTAAIPSSSSANSRIALPTTSGTENGELVSKTKSATIFAEPGRAEDQVRMEKLLQEQKELQLLESRIREAARQNLMHQHGGHTSGSGNSESIKQVAKYLTENASSSSSGSSSSYRTSGRENGELKIMEKQAALYLERLAQYEELAANDDDEEEEEVIIGDRRRQRKKKRDTVADAERNGGVIEGGTWEHRKRAKEMLKTAANNLELTLLGSGKHHMSDYLPPDILNAFLQNAQNVISTGVLGSAGSSGAIDMNSTSSTNSENPSASQLGAMNVGYQLMQKSGWQEGQGLGATNSGITQPITATTNANTTNRMSTGSTGGGAGTEAAATTTNTSSVTSAAETLAPYEQAHAGAGIGVAATHSVIQGDDEFDQYRKRMMLAYRFRPNPMNNPRRNYY